MLEEQAKHNHTNYWIVEECRGCGRSYVVPAPASAGASTGDARTKCAVCDTTNATSERVAEPDQVSEVLDDA